MHNAPVGSSGSPRLLLSPRMRAAVDEDARAGAEGGTHAVARAVFAAGLRMSTRALRDPCTLDSFTSNIVYIFTLSEFPDRVAFMYVREPLWKPLWKLL